MLNTIQEALEDLRAGKMIIVVDDEDRENEGDLIMAAEKMTPQQMAFIVKHTSGIVCASMTSERLNQLGLPQMVNQNTESHRTAFTVSVDYKIGTTTGVSASDRTKTILALTNSNTQPNELAKPGHIFPLKAMEGGVLQRAGHTEAAVDLMKLAGLSPAGVLCEVIKEDGEMARLPELKVFAKAHDLKIITIQDLIEYRSQNETLIQKEAESTLETNYGKFKVHVYTSLIDLKEHVALSKGDIKKQEATMVRVHSECMTGDIFASKHCDCGEQLDKALKMISENEHGVLLYMRQEGRGIGLANKIKAYDLQQQGMDTVEANHKLGFKMDLRTYGIGAQILADIGVKEMDILTNNPKKLVALEGHGLKIRKRIPIEIKPNQVNLKYLKTKKGKMGHLLTNLKSGKVQK